MYRIKLQEPQTLVSDNGSKPDILSRIEEVIGQIPAYLFGQRWSWYNRIWHFHISVCLQIVNLDRKGRKKKVCLWDERLPKAIKHFLKAPYYQSGGFRKIRSKNNEHDEKLIQSNATSNPLNKKGKEALSQTDKPLRKTRTANLTNSVSQTGGYPAILIKTSSNFYFHLFSTPHYKTEPNRKYFWQLSHRRPYRWDHKHTDTTACNTEEHQHKHRLERYAKTTWVVNTLNNITNFFPGQETETNFVWLRLNVFWFSKNDPTGHSVRNQKMK